MRTFLTIILLSPLLLIAQNQGNIWYFGNQAGIDFNTSTPTYLLDGLTDFPSCCGWNEGSSSICDDNGVLLFYTNGRTIWNSQQLVMSNGSGLMGHASSTQSSIIVPKPNNNQIYYVFTTDAMENNFENGLRYSVVDMCLDDGYGGVLDIEKNVKLADSVSEKLVCVQHSNGIDYWIIVHKLNTNLFYSFLLSNTGISNPIVSQTANVGYSGIGQMKASPNGQMLVNATISNSNFTGYHSLLDFNNSTGIISNERTFPSIDFSIYAVEFSPDNSKLYCSIIGAGEVFQYDLNASSFQDIIASKTSIISSGPDSWRQMQLGPDGKIYISRTMQPYLSVIELPNNLAPNCNYNDEAVYLGGKLTSLGLPNFIAGFHYSNNHFDCLSEVGILNSENTFSTEILPNPFSFQTTIHTSELLIDATLTIYNSSGLQVRQMMNISGKTITLNRDNLPSGFYILLIEDRDIVFSIKLFIN